MAHPAPMAQVNVRIDQQLKLAGDAVLGQMGITPTQLIRAVWSKVAGGAKACDQLIDTLASDSSANATSAHDQEESIAPTRSEWLEFRQQQLAQELGMDLSTFVPHSDEELDELMLAEYFANGEDA